MVLRCQLSKRPHLEHSRIHNRIRNRTEPVHSAALAKVALRSLHLGCPVDFSGGAMAFGMGCAWANRCAGGYVLWYVHTLGDQLGS
jgi:hypothetical protein